MMKENKKIFEEPKLDVIKFTAQDVIATSGESYGNEAPKFTGTPDFDIIFG